MMTDEKWTLHNTEEELRLRLRGRKREGEIGDGPHEYGWGGR